MSSSPQYQHCPAGVWTTIYRGMLPLVGYFKIYAKNTPVRPEYAYSAWSISPIFARSGTSPAYTESQIWIGPTPYAELKVKPQVDSYFGASGI
jgi:hypothetical protein